MSDSSLLSTFPLELIHEIIRNSDASTLASWSLVSRPLLAFAAPLLHETVTLSRSQDVVPFLERLRRNTQAQRFSSPVPFPSLSFLKRLEILALPSQDDLVKLLRHFNPVSQEIPVLGISWEGQEEKDMTTVWIPCLLLFLRPQRYEELGKQECSYLSGELLDFYVRGMSDLDPEQDAAGTLGPLYSMLLRWSSAQETIDTTLQATLNPTVSRRSRSGSTSVLLDSLIVRRNEIGEWFQGKSLLGHVDPSFDRLSDLYSHLELQTAKFKEFIEADQEMRDEKSRVLEARNLARITVCMLETLTGLKRGSESEEQ